MKTGGTCNYTCEVRGVTDDAKVAGSDRAVRMGRRTVARSSIRTWQSPGSSIDDEMLLREALQKLDIVVLGMKTQCKDGHPVFLVDKGSGRISRKLGWNDVQVQFVNQHKKRKMGAAPKLVAGIEDLPTRNVADFVERLAEAYGIQYKRSGLDDFAEAVTRAAGDDVTIDITGKLLIALKKNYRINGLQFSQLMLNHIRETKSVCPIRPIRRLRNQGSPA